MAYHFRSSFVTSTRTIETRKRSLNNTCIRICFTCELSLNRCNVNVHTFKNSNDSLNSAYFNVTCVLKVKLRFPQSLLVNEMCRLLLIKRRILKSYCFNTLLMSVAVLTNPRLYLDLHLIDSRIIICNKYDPLLH